MRRRMIGAGFTLLGATGLHRLAPTSLRGIGAILMLHHVRPRRAEAFRPNGLLEITPEFLDALVIRLRQRGYDIVTLDEALAMLAADTRPPKPFVALTFDDGYRDNRDHALPILERHGCPFTLYVTPGFAERSARLWWIELEEAIRRSRIVEVSVGDETLVLPAEAPKDKRAAWDAIYARLRRGDETQLLDVVGRLCAATGIDREALVGRLCMDWNEIVALSRHPLVTIGAHTMTHPRLAKLDAAAAIEEMDCSREVIEAKIGRPVRHFAYPVGDPTSAGPREFEAARRLAFASAVTTRPGLLFGEHAAHLHALPRLSINGDWQDLTNIEVLLSGAAFALWNRGRKVNAA